MAKNPTPAALRRKQQARVKDIVKAYAGNDPFGGFGDWDPCDAPKTAIARAIAALEGMRIPKPKAAQPKPVKRAPAERSPKATAAAKLPSRQPKAPPKPKKGKKVGTLHEVMIKSPLGHAQPIPLVPELRELLIEGWEIVGDETLIQEAHSFLKFKPEELQSA